MPYTASMAARTSSVALHFAAHSQRKIDIAIQPNTKEQVGRPECTSITEAFQAATLYRRWEADLPNLIRGRRCPM